MGPTLGKGKRLTKNYIGIALKKFFEDVHKNTYFVPLDVRDGVDVYLESLGVIFKKTEGDSDQRMILPNKWYFRLLDDTIAGIIAIVDDRDVIQGVIILGYGKMGSWMVPRERLPITKRKCELLKKLPILEESDKTVGN